MQYLKDVADPLAPSNSGEMERVAVSRRRLPGAGQLAVQLSGAALVVGVSLFFFDRLFSAARSDLLAVDFRQTYLPAADALLDGRSPYPEYGYPPLVAFLSLPFAIVPRPEVLVTIAMIACIPLSLWLLGVRDWRCYAAVFLWSAVFNAVQTANVTLPMLVGIAACWRWRDRSGQSAFAGGLTAAAKIIAWPLAVWLAATRRWVGAAGVLLVAVGVTCALWAILGFSGLGGYIHSLVRLSDREAPHSYTIQALAADTGLHAPLPGVLASSLALFTIAGVVFFARRGDDARSYTFAVAAVIVASPIVWLHSFALLLAPVAVLRPRLSPVWLLPAVLWFVSPGTGNGAPWQTALTLGVFALVVAAVLLPGGAGEPETGWGDRPRTAAGQAT